MNDTVITIILFTLFYISSLILVCGILWLLGYGEARKYEIVIYEEDDKDYPRDSKGRFIKRS